MDIMKNLVTIIVSRSEDTLKLVKGFLYSKGFRPFEGTTVMFPMLATADNKDKVDKLAKTIVGLSPKSRIVLVVAEPRLGTVKSKLVSQVYHVKTGKDSIQTFLDLERVLRTEKETARGLKPGPSIKVPGKK
jgi:hypothetical protein